jgi:hypothetical protein
MRMEGMNKRRWLTLFFVVLATTMFRLMAQGFMPAGNYNLFPQSAIARAGLIPVAFTLFGLLTYGLLAIVFVLVQGRLPGTRIMKGLMFGLLFGGMWIGYLLEPLPHSEGLSPIDILAYPIADSITLVLEGLLMGRFIAIPGGPETRRISPCIVTIASVPVLFLAGRLLCYNVFHVYSSIDYFMFNLFVPMVFDYQIWPIGAFLSYADLFLRVAMDIIFVIAGVYIYEKASSTINRGPKIGNESKAKRRTE